ncbi:Oidioi.mRNA.OKI2018_I69.chr1.g1500.t2.cds [Oikopleura dioica]|uniref:Oidioi.mRNA.OKI2018_I69.chr1.g1500.t2.cds n=1 Tax=Oikopleura dioica TaxID=34765 RepID=A0ABN7SXC1_OIKDI|nr:Oidioi.mRNA.OKI2018_I69.chr1.g1500.t2.cds [Oikopleura dioica]
MKRIPVQVYVRNDVCDPSPPIQAQISIDQSTGLIDYYSKTDSTEIRTVEISRKNSSFGISIKGGDKSNQSGSSRPIFISKCDRRHSNINIGDRIIACNEKSMLNATHKEAVDAIQSSGDKLRLQVRSETWKTTHWPIELSKIYQELGCNPLWMARLSRATKFGDHCIEVASGCLSNRIVVKCESEAVADDCVLALQRTKNHFTKMKSFNEALAKQASMPKCDQFLKDLNTASQYCIRMDWVFHENERKHYLMMLTSQELRFYDALPKDWEGWSKPVFGTPLLSAHIIDKKSNILIRMATQREVRAMELRCSGSKSWLESIKETRNDNVRDIKEALVEVIYNNATAYLGIHWLEGIRLYEAKTRNVIVHQEAHALTNIEDDNKANLTLQFKDTSKYTLVLGDGLKPFIFVMLNFYAAAKQSTLKTNNNKL